MEASMSLRFQTFSPTRADYQSSWTARPWARSRPAARNRRSTKQSHKRPLTRCSRSEGCGGLFGLRPGVDNSAAFADSEDLVGLHLREPLDLLRGRPLHFDEINGLSLSKAKV